MGILSVKGVPLALACMALPILSGPTGLQSGTPWVPLDVIVESIFGAASEDDWQPLGLSTFFTQCWHEAWVKSPPGD
jgi:hypothetical protein